MSRIGAAAAAFSCSFCWRLSRPRMPCRAFRRPPEAFTSSCCAMLGLPRAPSRVNASIASRRRPHTRRDADRAPDSLLDSSADAQALQLLVALSWLRCAAHQGTGGKLRADPACFQSCATRIRRLDRSPRRPFSGLSAVNGAWDQLGGGNRAGDNVIVGVSTPAYGRNIPVSRRGPSITGPLPAGVAAVERGQRFPASSCNSKLIGARWFDEGFGGDEAIKSFFPYEFLSPRAANGHGVHTAGIAVSNYPP